MKKIKFFIKKIMRKIGYKFIRILIPVIVCITFVICSSISASAIAWNGEGIKLDIYSSYFWDIVNGRNVVNPDVNGNHLEFHIQHDYYYSDSQLYIFCEVEDIGSYYGYFHCEIVGKYSTLEILPSTGIYEIAYNSQGHSTLGNKIIDFQSIGSSDIAFESNAKYPLPEKFIFYIRWKHADNDDVGVSAFNLSYTQHYPIGNGTAENDKILHDSDGLLKAQSDILDENFDPQSFFYTFPQAIWDGLYALRGIHTQVINRVPYLDFLIKASFIIGMNGLIIGMFNGIYNHFKTNHSRGGKR